MGHMMIEKEGIRRIGKVAERDQVEVEDTLIMEDINMQRFYVQLDTLYGFLKNIFRIFFCSDFGDNKIYM